jgi:hypothetical protein
MGVGPDAEEAPALSRLLVQRRIVFAAIAVALLIGVLAAASRSDPSTIVPDLIGVRVDPQLDALRLRLETAGLALDDVLSRPVRSSTSRGRRSNECPARSSISSLLPGSRLRPRRRWT